MTPIKVSSSYTSASVSLFVQSMRKSGLGGYCMKLNSEQPHRDKSHVQLRQVH